MPQEKPKPSIPVQSSQAGERDIDLCLSGGGFRATLFHLGVVLYLKRTGNLHRVKGVFAVSGGAILAADLISRWPKYTESGDDSLADVIAPLLDPITRRSFRDRVIAYSAYSLLFPFIVMALGPHLIPFRWGIGASVAVGVILLLLRLRYFGLNNWGLWLYHSWFSFRGLWRDLPADRPKLHLLATDLLTGRLGEFSPDGFRLAPDPVSTAGKREQNHSISLAVNASAAFPPLFPPQVISNDGERAVLTDGGVFDNLGIHAWEETGGLDRNSLCVVCDAGCEFVNQREGLGFRSVVVRNARSSDIVMNRLAEKDLQLLTGTRKISIRRTSQSTSELAEAVRVYVPRIRTDLDRFTTQEAVALILHGMDVAESVNEADMGRLTETDRDTIHVALKRVFRLRTPGPFVVSHADLEQSHLRSFHKLWHVGLVYMLATLYAVHLLGALPLWGVGIAYNAWFDCPAFHQELDQKLNMVFQRNEILQQAFAEHTGDQGNLIYKSNLFAGPTVPSDIVLTFSREGLKERELTVGNDFFAILVPEYGGLPEHLWLPCRVANESELRIRVPPFRGFARILLSADSPRPLKLSPKEYQEAL